MSSVRHVEHPQQAHLKVFGRGAAGVPVKSAPAKLWLTLRIEIHVYAVVLEYLNDGKHFGQRIIERFRRDEVKVIVRRVVLRVSSVRRSREASDRQVEAWRTILPLVVPVRHEIKHSVVARQAKDVSGCTVDESRF